MGARARGRSGRFLVGVWCVAAAVVFLAVQVPKAIRYFNGTVSSWSYITSPLERELTTGDIQGLPRDLQVEALDLIPPGSRYAVLIPPTQGAAANAGIDTITFESVEPFLQYLLLPSFPVAASEARYLVCWHCDLKQWSPTTTWVWRGDGGSEAIGRVRRA